MFRYSKSRLVCERWNEPESREFLAPVFVHLHSSVRSCDLFDYMTFAHTESTMLDIVWSLVSVSWAIPGVTWLDTTFSCDHQEVDSLKHSNVDYVSAPLIFVAVGGIQNASSRHANQQETPYAKRDFKSSKRRCTA